MSAALSLQIYPSIMLKGQACAVSVIFCCFSSFCLFPSLFYVRYFSFFMLLPSVHSLCRSVDLSFFLISLYPFPSFSPLSSGLCVSVYCSLSFLSLFLLSGSVVFFLHIVVFSHPFSDFFLSVCLL
jgi:hypothetical protein